MAAVKTPEYIKPSMNTLVAEFPSIINNNIDETLKILSNVLSYDNDGYIKIPVKTDGVVSANTGKFKNLSTDEISIKDTSSIKIDAKNVIYDGTRSIYDVINVLDSSVKELYNVLALAHLYSNGNNTNNNEEPILSAAPTTYSTSPSLMLTATSAADANDYINALEANRSYTYSFRYYNNVPAYDEKEFRCMADYKDIIAKQQYRYYNVNGAKYVKIDNDYTSAFRRATRGQIIIPIFDNKQDRDFIIKLSSSTSVKISAADAPIINMQLICTEVSKEGECTFNILNYSGKIELF